jgi:hypothetical protein
MFTANTMASVGEALGTVPARQRLAALGRHVAATSTPTAAARPCLELLRPRHHRASDPHPRGLRERHRRRHGPRWFYQRRAPPPRDRHTRPGSISVSRTSTRLAATVPHLADTKPHGTLPHGRPRRRRWRPGGPGPPARRAACSTVTCMTVIGQDHGREPAPTRAADTRTARSCTRSKTRSTPVGGIAILSGSLAPQGSVGQGGRYRLAARSTARLASSTAKTPPWPPSWPTSIAAEHGGRHPLRGSDAADRACARCWPSPVR